MFTFHTLIVWYQAWIGNLLSGGLNVYNVLYAIWIFNWYQSGYTCLVSLPKCDPWPLVFITMDGALYASMHVLDVDDCSMPRICENASMSVYSHDCDAILHDFLGVSKSVNVKVGRKRLWNFIKNSASFFMKRMP